MTDVNERLMEAAKAGDEVELKALLMVPGCDALIKDKDGVTALMWAACYGQVGCVGLLLPASDALNQDDDGMTALMWAAYNGHEACVQLLLPVSDALAKDNNDLKASAWAKSSRHEALARFIDAYGLARSELPSIGDAAGPGDPGGRARLRV